MDNEETVELEEEKELARKESKTVGNEDTGWTPTNDVLSANHMQLLGINYKLDRLVEFTDLINFIIKLACYCIIGAAIGWVLGTLINLSTGNNH